MTPDTTIIETGNVIPCKALAIVFSEDSLIYYPTIVKRIGQDL